MYLPVWRAWNCSPKYSACSVNLPPSSSSSVVCVGQVEHAAQLYSGSCCMALHYKTIVWTLYLLPDPNCVREDWENNSSFHWSKSHRIISFSACIQSNLRKVCRPVLLMGIDESKSKGVISDPVITLFNGLKGATMKYGERLPTPMAVISSNFTAIEQEK